MVVVHRWSGLQRWSGLLFFLASWLCAAEDEDRQLAQNIFHARSLLPWAPSARVEVYYAEFLLAQWVLDRAPWNAYHSGLAFLNKDTGEKCLYDYSPVDTSSVMRMLIPEILANKFEVFLGDYELTWSDHARTQLTLSWPSNYERFVLLGDLNGQIFLEFVDWVAKSFAPKHHIFQPIEVADVLQRQSLVNSSMCHDFVTEGLWFLYAKGAELHPEEHVFRDHIILYAHAARLPKASWSTMRQWQRYLRQLDLSMARIKKQFTFAREALLWNWRLQLPTFLHTENQSFQIDLAPPFLNYCYLPLAIPPEVHNPFGETKLCALGLQANTSNSTAPWPWGTQLTVEEHLDRPEATVPVSGAQLGARADRRARPKRRQGWIMVITLMSQCLTEGLLMAPEGALSASERQALQVARQAIKKERSQLSASLARAQERLVELQERCQVLRGKKQRLEQRKKDLEEEVQRNQAAKTEHEAKVASEEEHWTQEQRPSLEAQLELLKQHRDAWQELCSKMRRQVVQHEHQLKELQEENEANLRERERLQGECLNLQEACEDAQAQLSDAQHQLKEDTSTVEKMVLERVALEQTMEDMGFALTSL
ncbi:unnamed protein product [Durusdinium trenchii]|uniref:Uncharacterized protein n=1 Tax=Durusdinium trenchii TaxID=1381693 RepID=A0ABP0N0B3_9DINO